MKRVVLGLLSVCLLSIISACSGAPAEIRAALGQEFNLPIGQSATITGEDIQIRFDDVLGDSRCPLNVTCVWEGVATSVIYITNDGTEHRVVLSEPGLTDSAGVVFGDYGITFHLLPYPEESKDISKEDYYLELTVSQQSSVFKPEDQADRYTSLMSKTASGQ